MIFHQKLVIWVLVVARSCRYVTAYEYEEYNITTSNSTYEDAGLESLCSIECRDACDLMEEARRQEKEELGLEQDENRCDFNLCQGECFFNTCRGEFEDEELEQLRAHCEQWMRRGNHSECALDCSGHVFEPGGYSDTPSPSNDEGMEESSADADADAFFFNDALFRNSSKMDGQATSLAHRIPIPLGYTMAMIYAVTG